MKNSCKEKLCFLISFFFCDLIFKQTKGKTFVVINHFNILNNMYKGKSFDNLIEQRYKKKNLEQVIL